jgi:hypothetical protein
MASKRNAPMMFKRHLYYEIEQLALSYWRARAGLNGQELVNLYVESFCLHAKTLLEFLIRKPGDDMAAAADFADGSYVRPKRVRGNELDQVLGRLNIELSHLSWARPDNQSDQIGPDYRDKVWTLVRTELHKWAACLRPEFSASDIPLSLLNGLIVNTVPTLSQMSATNAISSTTFKA